MVLLHWKFQRRDSVECVIEYIKIRYDIPYFKENFMLNPCTEKQDQILAISFRNEIMSTEYYIDREYLKKHSLIAVPQPDFLPSNDIDLFVRMSKYYKDIKISECFAISTQSFEPPIIYAFEPSVEHLMEFDSEARLNPLLLFSKSPQLVIFQEGDSIMIFMGKKEIIETVLGKTIEGAKQVFLEYCNDVVSFTEFYEYLKKVYTYYYLP